MASTPPKTTAHKNKTRAKAGKTTARVEDKRAIAMQMLLAGHNCPDIGKALEVTRQRAWQLATEALAELKAETLEDAATWRALLTQEHMEQLRKGKTLRDGTPPAAGKDGTPGLIEGFAVVNTALGNLRSLWVPALPTSVKQELTGANGGPLQTMSLTGPDLSHLSDEQLSQLEKILESVPPVAAPPLQEP